MTSASILRKFEPFLLPIPVSKPRILSVDGGGVRGLIPLQLLKFLEQRLQELDGEEARLADYFNIMAGTSTGCLITTMLATPDPKDDRHNRPYCSQKIEDFYFDNASSIFPQPSIWNLFHRCFGLCGPKYNGKHLVHILEQLKFHETRLRDTVTNLVIPTFDIKTQFPTIFSTNEAKKDPLKNPYLSDVCLSTTAAPTYFPPRQIKTNSINGKSIDYNLVDGGIAANNPSLIAVNLVTQEAQRIGQKEQLNNFIVLSLGTGREDLESIGWDAKKAAKWGSLRWITKCGRSPLIDSFMNASSDMVDIQTALRFSDAKENYLRIQELGLTHDEAQVDLSTLENLQNLQKKGQDLLDKPVRKFDLETGRPKEDNNGNTNRRELIKMAERLSKEKKLRDQGDESL